jgi:universal stress protein A
MENYKHILVCIDLSDESKKVFARAQALAQSNQAKLSLLHVIEPLSFAYGGDIPIDLTDVQEQLQQQAQKHLESFTQESNLTSSDCHIIVGQPVAEAHRLAEEYGADLIVVGSHGRHGLALLLGSTANGILHGAGCDVMAVRVPN